MSGRRSDMDLLRPNFRAALERLEDGLEAAGSPLRVFETVRSPARQEELYQRGRDPKADDFGRTVTRARAYQSAHQHGLAADLVGWVDGKWTWDLPDKEWRLLGTLAKREGLEQLDIEQPHVQLVGFDWKKLARGPYDDAEWEAWLRR